MPRSCCPSDPLGRKWWGWKDTATDDVLWEHNCGLWALTPQARTERLATLSREGRIQVVVEVNGHTRHDVAGHPKWELAGTVLRAGDPVHDELKGALVPRQRGQVGSFDTTALDVLSPAERSRFTQRDPATMIVGWNPNERAMPDYPDEVKQFVASGFLRYQWATGNRKSGIEPGDRVFFLRQDEEPRGIIGSGTATSRIFPDVPWSPNRVGGSANYVLIEWDTLLLPEDGLPHAVLSAQIPVPNDWSPQGSGWKPQGECRCGSGETLGAAPGSAAAAAAA